MTAGTNERGASPEPVSIHLILAAVLLSSGPILIGYLAAVRLTKHTLMQGELMSFVLVVLPALGLILNVVCFVYFVSRPTGAAWILTIRAIGSLVAFACMAVFAPLILIALKTLPLLGFPAAVLYLAELVGEALFILAAIYAWQARRKPARTELTQAGPPADPSRTPA